MFCWSLNILSCIKLISCALLLLLDKLTTLYCWIAMVCVSFILPQKFLGSWDIRCIHYFSYEYILFWCTVYLSNLSIQVFKEIDGGGSAVSW